MKSFATPGDGPLLVTGASGFLGRRLVAAASPTDDVLAASCCHPERCPAAAARTLDLSDPEAAEEQILAWGPSAIVHTAAINPGGDEDRMDRVNRAGSEAVARAARRLGARLVHVSTDVVHDGDEAPYADDAAPRPLSTYGRSKADAEVAVLGTCPDALVVRTSLIYDLEEMDRGTSGFVERLRRGEPVRLFTDQIRHPIAAPTLAAALLELVSLPVAGLLNVAGEQALTREAFGRRILAHWGIAGPVEGVLSTDLGLRIPRDLQLDVTRARDLLSTRLLGFDDVLSHHRSRS